MLSYQFTQYISLCRVITGPSNEYNLVLGVRMRIRVMLRLRVRVRLRMMLILRVRMKLSMRIRMSVRLRRGTDHKG